MFAGLRKKWRDQIGQTKTILGEKVREALASVVPITLIVLILCFTAAPVPTDVLLAFLVGAVLLIVGMGLFTLGADTAMLPIGERVGAQMTKSRKLWVVVCVSLLIGIIVTISEPDLQVLAGQVPGIPNAVLIGAVAVGVGINLHQTAEDFPPELREKAGSVEMLTGKHIAAADYAVTVFRRFEELFFDEKFPENQERILRRYREDLFFLGQEVEVHGSSDCYRATALDIDEEGRLLVRDGEGTLHALNSGEISIRFS